MLRALTPPGVATTALPQAIVAMILMLAPALASKGQFGFGRAPQCAAVALAILKLK